MAFPMGSAKNYLQLLKKPSFHKVHHLNFCADEPNVVLPKSEANALGVGDVLDTIKMPGMHPTLPKWLALDKTILRFSAYVYEGPVESRIEECMRIRYCDIFYYMEDDTIMITEKLDDRAETSNGKGKLLNRQRVPKTGRQDSYISVHDLNVSKSVDIFSRHYFIYKCDNFTRATMTQMGFEVPEDSVAPFSQHLMDSAAEKHLNHRLRRHISQHHTVDRFLNHDKKVLRFYGYWDDRESLFGDRHFLVIHHYLGDQTTEVLRKVHGTLGKERLEPFFKRSKIPKDFTEYDKANLSNPWPVLNIVSSHGKQSNESHLIYDQAQCDALPAIVADRDLCCGTGVVLMARLIFLYDCDAFTRWYYKETYGYEQQAAKVDPPQMSHVKPPPSKPPPFNGYGTEQDSLRNCEMLVPRPPVLDVRKYLLLDWDDQDPTVLVFNLQLLPNNRHDEGRTFIMSFYLNNDNIYIYEKDAPQGVAVGSFHSRKSVKKANDPVNSLPQYLQPEDLYIGGVYMFNGQAFGITAMDEGTTSFMEKYPKRFPYADAKHVLEKFTRAVVASGERRTLENLTQMLTTDSESVSWSSFIDVLRSTVHNALTPHQYYTLARQYQLHTQANQAKMAQLLRAIIQHHLRRTAWDPTLHLLLACTKADFNETGYLPLSEMVRCVRAVRAPANLAVFTTYFDLVATPGKDVDYRRMVQDFDWVRYPVQGSADIPQNIGKDFDYSKYFGDMVPVVRYKPFLEDVSKIFRNLTQP